MVTHPLPPPPQGDRDQGDQTRIPGEKKFGLLDKVQLSLQTGLVLNKSRACCGGAWSHSWAAGRRLSGQSAGSPLNKKNSALRAASHLAGQAAGGPRACRLATLKISPRFARPAGQAASPPAGQRPPGPRSPLATSFFYALRAMLFVSCIPTSDPPLCTPDPP